MTSREEILAKREGFIKAYILWDHISSIEERCSEAKKLAAEYYPLPHKKILNEQPGNGCSWQLLGGTLRRRLNNPLLSSWEHILNIRGPIDADAIIAVLTTPEIEVPDEG